MKVGVALHPLYQAQPASKSGITRPLTRAGSNGIAHRSSKNQRNFRPYCTESGDDGRVADGGARSVLV